jgi:hypothetical protein
MSPFRRIGLFLFCLLLPRFEPGVNAAMVVHTNFPGGAIELKGIDQETQTVTFSPAKHKNRGWACWWYFRLEGVSAQRPVTLKLNSPSSFGRPKRAMYSYDGKTWEHTAPGGFSGAKGIYRHSSKQTTVYFAWGPPFQLSDAQQLVRNVAAAKVGAQAFELCRTRGGNPVPALRWTSERKRKGRRPGVWIEARQHAWESGSSWVCQGLVNWLASTNPAAIRLRSQAQIYIVPIMDVDNVEIGAGGKNQIPHDHNRDWSDEPIYRSVAAAQQQIARMNIDEEIDLFIDLHNPGPSDSQPFFFASPKTHLPPPRVAAQSRFHLLCVDTLGRQPIGLSKTLRISGPGYHPLWRAISKNWVAKHTADHAVALTLETSWNTPHSTPEGYLAYGAALGQAIERFLLPASDLNGR